MSSGSSQRRSALPLYEYPRLGCGLGASDLRIGELRSSVSGESAGCRTTRYRPPCVSLRPRMVWKLDLAEYATLRRRAPQPAIMGKPMLKPLDPFRFVLIAVAGWMNQHQLQVIDYLREENLGL